MRCSNLRIAHRRADDHHRAFAACAQPLCQGAYSWIVPHCHDGLEVKYPTQTTIAGLGQTRWAVHRAARCPLVRRQAGIRSELARIDCSANLVDLGEHPRRCPRTDSGNRTEQEQLLLQRSRSLQLLLNQALGFGHLRPQERERRLDGREDGR
jgi:hypothetical protein